MKQSVDAAQLQALYVALFRSWTVDPARLELALDTYMREPVIR
jgi:hypothetical protein